jgi:hypothetical protein
VDGRSTGSLGDGLDAPSQADLDWLQDLRAPERARFLARLAHNLTISGRAVFLLPSPQLGDGSGSNFESLARAQSWARGFRSAADSARPPPLPARVRRSAVLAARVSRASSIASPVPPWMRKREQQRHDQDGVADRHQARGQVAHTSSNMFVV